MAFGTARNRRRQDAAQQKEALKGAVRTHGPAAWRTALAVALTGALAWGALALRSWALTSPTFALESVTCEGCTRATKVELTRLGGLAAGQNLLALDVEGLERALVAHPWVRGVEVRRRWPSAVELTVEEHQPAALVTLGELYVLSEEGVAFKRLKPEDGLDLPLVTGVDREAYVADEARVRERLREALAVARAYGAHPAGRRERLSEVRVEARGVSLVTSSGQEVRLGEGDWEAKLERLARVRTELVARGLAAEVVHLDNRARPGRVAVRISGAASERSGRPAQ